MSMNSKWYGFDVDGTIADNSAHTFGMGKIGKPIKPMCDLMKKLHAEGRRVKIFTARLSDVGSDRSSQQAVKEHIWKWCDENLGFRPEITDRKDYKMECLYDDRAKQVVRNTGECIEDLYRKLADSVRRDEEPRCLRNLTGEASAIIGAGDADKRAQHALPAQRAVQVSDQRLQGVRRRYARCPDRTVHFQFRP